MTPSLFRKLILIWWVIGVVSGAFAVFAPGLLPAELENYRESVLDSELTAFDWIVGGVDVIALVALVVASIRLYNFKPSGRTLFLWANIVLLCTDPAYGPNVVPAIASPLHTLDAYLTGGILFAMYLPPIGPIIDEQTVGS